MACLPEHKNPMLPPAIASGQKAPHKICSYIYELANAFNRFYHETKILAEEDQAKKESYLALADAGKKYSGSMVSICWDLKHRKECKRDFRKEGAIMKKPSGTRVNIMIMGIVVVVLALGLDSHPGIWKSQKADGTDATGTTGTGGKRSADNTDADGDTGAYG